MVEIHIRHGQASPQTGKLTEEGMRQAILAGEYIRSEFPRVFRHGFHSPSSRATKTAELLSLSAITWKVDKGLVEKQSSESWNEVIDRCQNVMRIMDATCPDANRILVYHGEAMQGMRAYREKLLGTRFAQLFEKPYKYFNNTQLIIYTNEAPEGHVETLGAWWVKSVCPWASERFGHDWILVKSSE